MNPDLKIIDNIKKNIENNELNKTVAIDDPVRTEEEIDKLIEKYNNIKKNKIKYNIDKKAVQTMIKTTCKDVYNNIEFIGLDKLNNLKTGAIITGNHYSPVDTIPIKELIKKVFNKELYIVSYASNLALKPPLDFIVNHENIIPIKDSISYLNDVFKPQLFDLLNKGEFVLIYPEQEMWNNYRKPRPCKRGAYQFASEANVPVISLYTELQDLNVKSNDNFNKLKYILHVIDVLEPNKDLSIRQNSIEMSKKDYELKVKTYEECFNKKLTYDFSYDDIAGYIKKNNEQLFFFFLYIFNIFIIRFFTSLNHSLIYSIS